MAGMEKLVEGVHKRMPLELLVPGGKLTHASVRPSLGHNAATALASEVDTKLRMVIQEAAKLMRCAKADTMTCQHVALAIRSFGDSPLLGFNKDAMEAMEEDFTTPADLLEDSSIFLADKTVNLNDIAGACTVDIANSEGMTDMDGQDAYNSVELPRQPGITQHYLAIDGVQPLVPQNPRRFPDQNIKPLLKPVTSVEDSTDPDADAPQVIKRVFHNLTEEFVLFYTKVTNAIVRAKAGDDAELSRVFESLANDNGLQDLLPYFTKFVVSEIDHDLKLKPRPAKLLPKLRNILRMVAALFRNRHLELELYYDKLIPAILTCAVNGCLCANAHEDHWSLRDFAAELCASVCQQLGDLYPGTKKRVIASLTGRIGARPNTKKFRKLRLPTLYGVLVCLKALGPLVTQRVLLAYIPDYMRVLTPLLRDSKQIRREEARRCISAVEMTVGEVVAHQYTSSCSSALRDDVADAGAMLLSGTALDNALASLPAETLLPYRIKSRRRHRVEASSAAVPSLSRVTVQLFHETQGAGDTEASLKQGAVLHLIVDATTQMRAIKREVWYQHLRHRTSAAGAESKATFNPRKYRLLTTPPLPGADTQSTALHDALIVKAVRGGSSANDATAAKSDSTRDKQSTFYLMELRAADTDSVDPIPDLATATHTQTWEEYLHPHPDPHHHLELEQKRFQTFVRLKLPQLTEDQQTNFFASILQHAADFGVRLADVPISALKTALEKYSSAGADDAFVDYSFDLRAAVAAKDRLRKYDDDADTRRSLSLQYPDREMYKRWLLQSIPS